MGQPVSKRVLKVQFFVFVNFTVVPVQIIWVKIAEYFKKKKEKEERNNPTLLILIQ